MLQKMMNHHEDVMNATIGGIQQRAQKVTVSNERGWNLRQRMIATWIARASDAKMTAKTIKTIVIPSETAILSLLILEKN